MPLLGDNSHKNLIKWLSSAASSLPTPKAILTVSAHWEEKVATVTSGSQPSLLYDYYGFPEEAYKIKYDARGSLKVAQRVANLLQSAGLSCNLDSKRGWDHGVFVPLKLLYPAADIPVIVLSMLNSLSAEEHMKLGEALAPLRDEGVLILGSGLSYHNMQGFRLKGRGTQDATSASKEFDAYIQDAMLNPEHSVAQRRQLLVDWEQGPSARACHPREEHLLPLMVAAGAANFEQAAAPFDEEMMSVKVSGFLWS